MQEAWRARPPEVAGCAAFVPTLHIAFDLSYMYSVQMNSVGSLLASYGIWWFDGSQMLAATRRYDAYHIKKITENRQYGFNVG